MNIIICTKNAKKPGSFHMGQWRLFALMLLVLVILPGTVMYAGFNLGKNHAQGHLLPEDWESEMMQSREEIAEAARTARENMNAFTLRLGQLQAQAARLNALGRRLVEAGKLDSGEFDFANPPAQGGPLGDESEELVLQQIEAPDFLKSLDELAAQLDSREQQLRVMESLFMSQSLRDEVVPSGRPIHKGWISSYYGMRADPFTGRQERHKGMDFAGKDGSEIIAAASGVVTWSGKRYGYGLMVEVNHGNGYATRYAHSRKTLVKIGDVVEKGQQLAEMGSSGRSTGPHVHYEVIYQGRVVDPAKYVYAAK
jgi:murein DD-endopeptidase MepM/ murein hydrolase activator NlpD